MTKKLISIITPVFNEEQTIDNYYTLMKQATDELADTYDFEFIITDNCSTDNTYKIFEELAKKDPRIRVFRFSRNFGYQKSIWTGYTKARGDAAIEFDCDLQDPPSLLAEFLKHWEDGNKIVYGIRKQRQEGFIITSLRKAFYRLVNAISAFDLPVDAGDFMLIDRVILDNLKSVNDHRMYLRGIIFGFGYMRKGIEYKRQAREIGDSKFSASQLIGLAMDGVISQSTIPLKLASYIGLLVAFVMTIVSGGYILVKLFTDIEMPAGFTTTVILILFSISLNAIFLGIIGEYLGRIYQQTRNRPLTIIDHEIENTPHNDKEKAS